MKYAVSPKTILIPYSGEPEDQAALEYALNLALINNAHVDVWHIMPDPADFYTYPYLEIMVYPANNEIERASKEGLKKARENYAKTLEKMKVENVEKRNEEGKPSASFRSATGRVENVLSLQGRVADLIIIPRTDLNINFNLADSILFSGARPVIFVPPGNERKAGGKKVLIAWNGSRESARAVADSLPYLKGKEVMILTSPEKRKRPYRVKT